MLPHSDPRTGPSFSLGNRIARAIWNTVWLLMFRPTPRPLHAWRRLLLQLFGARIGSGCRIHPGVRIWAPWNLECGRLSAIGSHATLYNQDKITIGNHCVISQGAHLCTGSHDYQSPTLDLWTKPITIQDHVWIAAEAFILPGTLIEEGAVIGARSVVTEAMPAWKVCAGHPCRPLKDRNRFQVIS